MWLNYEGLPALGELLCNECNEPLTFLLQVFRRHSFDICILIVVRLLVRYILHWTILIVRSIELYMSSVARNLRVSRRQGTVKHWKSSKRVYESIHSGALSA